MPLINLSEEYAEKFNSLFYERIRMAFNLDLYWASSLYAIEEHFKQNPPRKKDSSFSKLSAYIIINCLEIKRCDDSFEEDDWVSLEGLDRGLLFPFFEIRDGAMGRIACWMGGQSSEYLESQEEFSFNRESYVSIPKMLLQYIHDNGRGLLAIKSLNLDRKPQTKRKSLKDKILELVPEFSPILQPSY